jgi:hypothetical protein
MSTIQHTTPVQMLYTGIYSDERVLQLLHILQTLSEHCFSKLHEVSNEGRPSSTEYANRFRKGLDSIEFWRTEIKSEETNLALQHYPELGALYKYAIVCYLKELYKNERTERIPVSIPPLQDFLHAYYVALSKTSYMQKLEFLNVYGLERTHMHMEALRTILMEFTRHSVYRAKTSPEMTYVNPSVSSTIRGLVSVEKDVTPWDSVSQRGDRQYEDEIIQNPPTPVKSQISKVQQGSRTQVQPQRAQLAKSQFNPQHPSIYDRATENYYGHKDEEEDEPDAEPDINPVLPSPEHKDRTPRRNIEIEKEESEESDHSSSSSESSGDLKFKQKPVFPKESSSRTSRASSAKPASSTKSAGTSSHTIHLNVPERTIPRPPSPVKKSERRSQHSQEPKFF